MTEFPITEAFLNVIEDTARKSGAKRVTKVWLRLGKGAQFSWGTSAYLEHILKGTAARDAEIFIKRGYYAGKCRCCRLIFANERQIVCPACGGASDSVSLEKRFIIEMLEVEQ